MVHTPHRKWSRPDSALWMVHVTQRIDNNEVIQDSGVMGDIMTLELTQGLRHGRSEYMDLF